MKGILSASYYFFYHPMILIKCCIHIATNVVSLIFVIQCVGREPTVDCRSQNSQISRFWFGKRRVIDGDDDCGDGDLPLDGSRGACFRKYCLVACTLIAVCEKYLKEAYLHCYMISVVQHCDTEAGREETL